MTTIQQIAEDTAIALDDISDTMCMAKWLQVSMHLPQGMTQSCYHPPTHEVPLSELEVTPKALHNTVHKVLERKDMWEGKRPSGCSYCWNIEDAPEGPHLSDRHYRSGEWWVTDAWNEVVDGEWDENINPRYVEVNFNQACNFKCTYCSPHLSTEWEKEIEEHGPIQMGGKIHNDIGQLVESGLMPLEVSKKDNPYVTAFWEWWPDMYKDLKVFRMTGGEPLMDKNTFKVLDYIVDHPNPDLELSITSNMCPTDQKLFDKFLAKIVEIESDVTEDVVEEWTNAGFIKSVRYYAKNNGHPDWTTWERKIVKQPGYKDYPEIDPGLERIDFNKIQRKFPNGKMLHPNSGDFLYDLIWFRANERQQWNCLGSYDTEQEGNEGISLDIARMNNFMLFVSLDSVGERAEYIRTGLEFKRLQNNVEQFLDNTKNTEVTFINTFNFLSITRLEDFLKYMLTLRQKYANEKGNRVHFDIPYLREPKWMSAQLAAFYPDLMKVLDHCDNFMQLHLTKDSYIGFEVHELAKLRRDIAWIKSGKKEIDDEELLERQTQFYLYFEEIDKRRNVDFLTTFPELQEIYFDMARKCGREIIDIEEEDTIEVEEITTEKNTTTKPTIWNKLKGLIRGT